MERFIGAMNSERRKTIQERDPNFAPPKPLTETHPLYTGDLAKQERRADNVAHFQGRTYKSGKPRQYGEIKPRG